MIIDMKNKKMKSKEGESKMWGRGDWKIEEVETEKMIR